MAMVITILPVAEGREDARVQHAVVTGRPDEPSLAYRSRFGYQSSFCKTDCEAYKL